MKTCDKIFALYFIVKASKRVSFLGCVLIFIEIIMILILFAKPEATWATIIILCAIVSIMLLVIIKLGLDIILERLENKIRNKGDG